MQGAVTTMSKWENPTGTFLLAGVLMACAGCSSTALETASLTLVSDSSVHSDKPVELYSKIARGALGCWFGSQGSLKKTHVFHADVAPETSGGNVEIVLHERDDAAASPRSLRTYRVTVTHSGEGSRMLVENLKMPEPVAKDMRTDLARWATGNYACSVVGAGGWNSAIGTPGMPTQAVPAVKTR